MLTDRLTALLLVRSVRTVRVTVAHPRQRDALAFGLPAGELVRVAHAFLCKHNDTQCNMTRRVREIREQRGSDGLAGQ